MTASGLFLGPNNILGSASGITIPLTRYDTCTFICWEDNGSQVVTVTELDSTAVNSEQALPVDGVNDYAGPGVGGAWIAGPGTLDATGGVYDLADDATNDTLVITVRADQLSDGYDSVQFTADGGAGETNVALLTDAKVQRLATNLTSSLTA